MNEGEQLSSEGGPAYVSGSVLPSVVDGGEWAASFGLSWTALMLFDGVNSNRMIRDGGSFARQLSGTMGIASARSEIAHYFLNSTDSEWLFMVDSDMSFGPDTVDRLVQSAETNNVKILGALCFAQKRDPDLQQGPYHVVRYRIQPTIYQYAEVKQTGEKGFQSITKYKRDAFQEVSGTGAACILIHRDVLKDLGADPFYPITDPNAGGNGTSRSFGEDLSFCIRVAAAGHRIGVDTSIKTAHYKGGIFLDEIQFAMQQETLIQAKGHEIARRAELYQRAGLVAPRGVK